MNAKTPNLDKLAAEGFLYENAFANALFVRHHAVLGLQVNGVSWVRTPRSSHNIPYDKIQLYPKLLQQAGYFTANGYKTDYNLAQKDAPIRSGTFVKKRK